MALVSLSARVPGLPVGRPVPAGSSPAPCRVSGEGPPVKAAGPKARRPGRRPGSERAKRAESLDGREGSPLKLVVQATGDSLTEV